MTIVSRREERNPPEKACKPESSPPAGAPLQERIADDPLTILGAVRVTGGPPSSHRLDPLFPFDYPAWLLTAEVTPTPEQLAQLEACLGAVDEDGQRIRRYRFAGRWGCSPWRPIRPDVLSSEEQALVAAAAGAAVRIA